MQKEDAGNIETEKSVPKERCARGYFARGYGLFGFPESNPTGPRGASSFSRFDMRLGILCFLAVWVNSNESFS